MIMAEFKKVANPHETIELYIQRVTELSQMGQKIPTQEELLKIASELGISDEEIKQAQQQSQAHFIRAQGYADLRHWDDAIEELEEALAFNPFNLPMLHLLINCYLGRWQNKHNNQDIEQIKIRVKQCLEIQPDDQESLNLLAKLDKVVINWKHQLWGFTAFGLLCFGTIVGFFVINNFSLNWLSKNDEEIDNLKISLMNEIESLKLENNSLYNQLNNQLISQKEINNNLKREVELLKSRIEKLAEENNNLSDKISNMNVP